MDTEKYFLDGMKAWLKFHNINKFVLCGHSMGGYLATKYVVENFKDVLSLILLAPAGVWPQPSNFNPMAHIWEEADGFLPRQIYKAIISYWKPGKSPFSLCRICGRSAYFAIKQYVNTFTNLLDQVL